MRHSSQSQSDLQLCILDSISFSPDSEDSKESAMTLMKISSSGSSSLRSILQRDSFKSLSIFFPFSTTPVVKSINILQQVIDNKICFINSLKEEINFKKINESIKTDKVKEKINSILQKITTEICAEAPNAFWNRKQHSVDLPYTEDFEENKITTKARPIAMGARLLKYCQEEIESLLQKGLIRPSHSPWSCPAFYVENASEIERGAPRLVINYKPL